MSAESRIGVTGLAVMGANLARNIARHDVPVALHNRTSAKTEALLREHGDDGPMVGTDSTEEFVAALAKPRAILIMVKAGKPVDTVIEDIKPHLDKGDILIDGGNSLFTDTQRRAEALEAEGLRYLGAGVSGGEEGALNGPSIMPGGTREAYGVVDDVLEAIAAQVDGEPCCTYIGPGARATT
jgi:6-phosphogluconate dehydrogenase